MVQGYEYYDDYRKKLKTQTKCTLFFSGMLVIELLPIPLTSIVSLYVIRKRPKWLPGVVERLYAEKGIKHDTTQPLFDKKNSIVTRKRCTIGLSIMVLFDFLIPFTVLMGLYVARRRPLWFKNIVSRLYADLLVKNENIDRLIETLDGKPADSEALENKFIELQKSNNEFALNIGLKN
jgi:hypothetical protein